MSDAFERPDWSTEAAAFAAYAASGLDRETASLMAGAKRQTAQSVWDQTHQEPVDEYSMLEGVYEVVRDSDDNAVVALHLGEIESSDDGQQFRRFGEQPLQARIVCQLGEVVLHYSSWGGPAYTGYGLRLEGDDNVYPALGKNLEFGGYDLVDGGRFDYQTEIMKLGYVHPDLFVPKPAVLPPPLVAGRDYYRDGYRVQDINGDIMIIEPDGTSWVEKTRSGLTYSNPDDMVGYYE